MSGEPLTLVIGDKNLSSWSLRPWLAMAVPGIPFQEVQIRLDRPETADAIRQHSPTGLVPVLKTPSITIWESLSILEYVHERFPEARLWPEDPIARAWARSVSAEMHAGFAALRAELPVFFAERKPGGAPSDAAARDIARIHHLWSEALSAHQAEGPFLFGRFSAADAMYAPVVSRFTTYGVAMPPLLAGYMERIWALPAMQNWLEGAQAECAGQP